MTGFHYSHDGYWERGYIYSGYKTLIECASTCMQDCFGIFAYVEYVGMFGNYDGPVYCYHYSNVVDLVSANVRLKDSRYKAYIKCSVPMNEGKVPNSKFCDRIY